MKLATRISLFFLAALAFVLIGFSGSIYWLVQSHLYYQLDDNSADALDSLAAAVESGPDGLEWDKSDRHLVIGQSGGGDPIVWGVFDNKGDRLDGSDESTIPLLKRGQTLDDGAAQVQDTNWNGAAWRIIHREVRADALRAQRASNAKSMTEEPISKGYPSLYLAVGAPTGHVTRQLQTLGMALVGLSVLIWLSAAYFGRWLCRNALAPLTRMAESMAMISAADLNRRLTIVASGDELEGLSCAFNDLLTRLEVSFERQRRFAAEASHQLRTPLTAMLGQVDVALRRDRSPNEYHKTLDSVHEQATRLRRIVEMLLFLTREESDAAPPQFESIELNNWLADHLSSWQEHPRHIDLRVELDRSAVLWVIAHEELLGQAVDNLIDNACKYSAPNSAIVVRTVRFEDGVELIVEDRGYGIAEDELARVVDPFFRSLDARQRGIAGTGLGLSIVQSIVNAFGAKMSIKSKVGHGSTFAITFRSPADKKLQCA